jgi:hypothetical protein
MRGKTGGHAHRDVCPTYRPFQGPLKISMAAEPQPATFGVTQPQTLDNGCHITWRWLTHSASRDRHGQVGHPGRADLDFRAQLITDPAVKTRSPSTVFDRLFVQCRLPVVPEPLHVQT